MKNVSHMSAKFLSVIWNNIILSWNSRKSIIKLKKDTETQHTTHWLRVRMRNMNTWITLHLINFTLKLIWRKTVQVSLHSWRKLRIYVFLHSHMKSISCVCGYLYPVPQCPFIVQRIALNCLHIIRKCLL